MKFITYGHRHAKELFESLDEYRDLVMEIYDSLDSISDLMIVEKFESDARRAKSISQAINELIKEQMVARGWASESYIFAEEEYSKNAKGNWRLDFAKENLSVEVAFNHRSDISWNLIKPTLASELNHVKKALQTSGGVIIAATEALKKAGGYDNACGTYEDYAQYCKPFYSILPAPLLIIGLEPPESFEISVSKTGVGNNKAGAVIAKSAIDGNEKICKLCGTVNSLNVDTCQGCGKSFAN